MASHTHSQVPNPSAAVETDPLQELSAPQTFKPDPTAERAVGLLKELLMARGPCGQEDEVREICRRELTQCCDEVKYDPAGNLIGVIRCGVHAAQPPVKLLAHMDELSMIVKRVEADGALVVRPLGNMLPANFGQGAVEILGQAQVLAGALTFGSLHVSAESKTWEIKDFGDNKAVNWGHARVVTRLSPQALEDAGVHPGSRVVLAQCRRGLQSVGDCLAGYFMDNRAPLTSMLLCAHALKGSRAELRRDVYFAATTMEEMPGVAGAAYAIKGTPEGLTVALDVAPVAEEYQVPLDCNPVIVFGDSMALYSPAAGEALLRSGRRMGLKPRAALLEYYGSDASAAKQLGLTSQAALACIPVLGTHGYEIMERGAMSALAALLQSYLCEDGGDCAKYVM